LSGNVSKFSGNLYLISYGEDGSSFLFSSKDGKAISYTGFGDYSIQRFKDASLYEFYTGTYIDSIRVKYDHYLLTQEAFVDVADNSAEYVMSITVTVRRNGSQIDSFTASYDQD